MIGITIRSNFDIKRFEVAAKHHRAAEEARARSVAAEDGSTAMSQAFDDELQATMVVVAAAAFALDALYKKLDDLLDPPSAVELIPEPGRSSRL